MSVDPIRHLSVFSPASFGDRQVDIIGVGATGSHVALSLAKLGVRNIHVWDFDKVEEHNIANQAFSLEHIGSLKVDALAGLVLANTGVKIHTHAERVDGSQTLGEVVFVLTDTMYSRKEIWEKSLRMKLRSHIMIETRMGTDGGRIYTVNPNKPSHIRAWEKTLFSDDIAEVSACGTSISVGPTAEIIAGLAVWQMIRWFAIENGADDELDNEIVFGLRPMLTISRQF